MKQKIQNVYFYYSYYMLFIKKNQRIFHPQKSKPIGKPSDPMLQ